ncbi:hypothetical protein D3C76_828840 [compost metagenome]
MGVKLGDISDGLVAELLRGSLSCLDLRNVDIYIKQNKYFYKIYKLLTESW